MPDLKEFVETVRRMREAQKLYFHSRDRHDLAHSKHLEKKVDATLAELTATMIQGKLY